MIVLNAKMFSSDLSTLDPKLLELLMMLSICKEVKSDKLPPQSPDTLTHLQQILSQETSVIMLKLKKYPNLQFPMISPMI